MNLPTCFDEEPEIDVMIKSIWLLIRV